VFSGSCGSPTFGVVLHNKKAVSIAQLPRFDFYELSVTTAEKRAVR
jgi:hypothetical protein